MKKKRAFVLDRSSQQADPNLADLYFDPRSNVAAFESSTGQVIHAFVVSRMGVALLVGAVLAAPSRPPVVAIEPFLAALAGDAAFTKEMRKYTGRLIRQVLEHVGGEFVRRAVKITVPSRYGSGSIYSFGDSFRASTLPSAIAELQSIAEHMALFHRGI